MTAAPTDAAAVCIHDGPAITTRTAGWRLPGALVGAAATLGPPPWHPGQLAALLVVHLTAGRLAADAHANSTAVTIEFDVDGGDGRLALYNELRTAAAIQAALTNPHHTVAVDWTLPDETWTWPPLVVDCRTGDAQIVTATTRVHAGPVLELPERWQLLAHAARITRAGKGWVPVLHA